VSGGASGTLKVWDAASLALVAEKSSAHSDYINSVAFSPDGTKIVSGSDDKTLKVWSADTLHLLEERRGDGASFDTSGNVAERDGSTLRLREGGGAFYAPSPISSVAVKWPRIVAGAQSGELYHIEVEEE